MLFHWSFDSVLLTLGPLSIHWYGVLFIGAFFAGQLLLTRIFRSEAMPTEYVERLMLHALVGTIVGARLVHCAFYDPLYDLSTPLAVLRIWEGGLASHGGAVGMLLGLWLGHHRLPQKIGFLWLLDRVAIAAALGAVWVRVANFLNSEIVGMPTSGHWGVVFDAVDNIPRHPVQLYEAATYLFIGTFLLVRYQQLGKQTPPGLLVGWFMVLVFMARIGLEFLKMPQATYETSNLFTVGQYLSLPFVLLGAYMLLACKK
jgi:phosphatidylglycerol---prolipoprotein diacylglyceryl transferase